MRKFGVRVEEFDVGQFGAIKYAQWLHPLAKPTTISEGTVLKLRKFISEGDVVIDIGSHVGDTTIRYAAAVGTSGKVIAFEPNPAVFEVVSESAKQNPDYDIVCVNNAITTKKGIYTFHYTDPDLYNGGFAQGIEAGIGACAHSYPVYVVGINLEDWLDENYADLIPRISFIKVDAEGFDKEIVKTFKNLFTRISPLLQTELFPYLSREERVDFYNIISSLDYSVFNFADANRDFDRLSDPLTLESFLALDPHVVFDLMCLPASRMNGR